MGYTRGGCCWEAVGCGCLEGIHLEERCVIGVYPWRLLLGGCWVWLLGGYSPGGTLCDRGIPVEVAVGRLLGVVAW